jgi:hypothetical protein
MYSIVGYTPEWFGFLVNQNLKLEYQNKSEQLTSLSKPDLKHAGHHSRKLGSALSG